MVFTAVDQRRVQYSSLTEYDAVVAVRINYLAAVENILRVLPDTNNVMVVVGTSPIEKFWMEEIGTEVQPLADRVTFTWTNNMSFEELLKRAAALPPQSAIFWELMIVDAAGVVHEGTTALTRLYAVANAPIFSYDESFFGRELVGGPLLSVFESSQKTAAVGVRILGGEKAGDIKIPPIQFATPKFDWRELQRWGISESRLPAGSEVHFRSPTAWEQYRLQILAICAAILAQAGLIAWLIYEHWRRQAAEVKVRTTMSELSQMNRIATAGELSASIAHEVTQPLTGISTSANAALRFLSTASPDVEKAKAALNQIVGASHRAGDVVRTIRTMFQKDSAARQSVNMNELISSVLALLTVELEKHQIRVETLFDGNLPPITGNSVQLQQVLLNLITNAIDAMSSVTSRPRLLRLRSENYENKKLLVVVQDNGAGISSNEVDQLFKPLFTTKPQGMGMGLSICQSIIEAHHGRIWASPGGQYGTVFQFVLPSSGSEN
jgi:signal transduction histidine kinase